MIPKLAIALNFPHGRQSNFEQLQQGGITFGRRTSRSMLYPINLNAITPPQGFPSGSWFKGMALHLEEMPDMEEREICLIGLGNKSPETANSIRRQLYGFKQQHLADKVADLGDFIFIDNSLEELKELSIILNELHQQEKLTVLMGGGQEALIAQYFALEKQGKVVNMVSVDASLDYHHDGKPNADEYLGYLTQKPDSYLYSYANLGSQAHLNDTETLALLRRFDFENVRLGRLRESMQEAEPVLRNCHMLSIDANAIRHYDCPAALDASPNGLTANEVCKLMHYAGMSDRLSTIGIHNLLASLDIREQGAKLAAQMIWYFIDGYEQRRVEVPESGNDRYQKYMISLEEYDYTLAFFKSLASDRWWMRLPIDDSRQYLFEQYMIPCSYRDYEEAMAGQLPERWVKAEARLQRIQAE